MSTPTNQLSLEPPASASPHTGYLASYPLATSHHTPIVPTSLASSSPQLQHTSKHAPRHCPVTPTARRTPTGPYTYNPSAPCMPRLSPYSQPPEQLQPAPISSPSSSVRAGMPQGSDPLHDEQLLKISPHLYGHHVANPLNSSQPTSLLPASRQPYESLHGCLEPSTAMPSASRSYPTGFLSCMKPGHAYNASPCHHATYQPLSFAFLCCHFPSPVAPTPTALAGFYFPLVHTSP